MKRSRLVLSTSYFGTGRLLGEEVSAAAARTLADDIALGPSLDPGDPKRFRTEFTARHLRVVAAENVWANARAEDRHRDGRELASPDPRERELAVGLTLETAENLEKVGGRILIVRLGNLGEIPDSELAALEDRKRRGQPVAEELDILKKKAQMGMISTLDRICRSLHAVLRRSDSIEVALVPGEPLIGAVNPETYEWIREDLKSTRLGYWHDPVIAHRWETLGIHESGTWLNRCARFMKGVFLHDAIEGEGRLPPGLGRIDLRGLQSYLPEDAYRVVWIDGKGGMSALIMAFDHLREMGFE